MRALAIVLIALHALVLVGHDLAHRSLGVGLTAWQLAFANSVIVGAPLVAAALLFTRFARLAYVLLGCSMLGSLVFSVYHHYVLVSPDHVSHLPPGHGQGLFRATAATMAFLELAGIAVGAMGWRRQTR